MIIPGIPFVQGRNAYTDRDGAKYGIAIHNTSNDASAEAEASYATRRTDGISSHLYVDADSVVQSLDTKDKAGHAGSSTGNENAVAVEITGTNGKSRTWWLANVAWDELGRALAAVIRHHWPDGSFKVRRASVAEMRSNPKVKAFYGHDDMRQAWGGTDHTDPGPNFPWDRLFAAVTAALEGDDVNATQDALLFNASSISASLARMQDEAPVKKVDGSGAWSAPLKLELVTAVEKVAADVAELKARPPVEPAPVDVAALSALIEAATERAVRKVLGGLDGATPTE